MLKCSSLLVLYVIGIVVQYTEAKVTVTITNATGISNPDFVKLKAGVRKTPAGVVVDLDSELLKDMTSGLQLWVELLAKNDVTGYETLFKSDDLDLCSLLETAKEHPLANPFIDKLKSYGNVPMGCPVPKGRYALNGFTIDGDLFPSFVPSGTFRVRYGVTNPVSADKIEKLFEMIWDVDIANDMKDDRKR